MKLQIENFQSIRKSEINLNKFVAIVGPTNRGKSAVIRALRVIFYNEWNLSYLRLGSKECKICIVFDDNEGGTLSSISLEKPINTYRILFKDGTEKVYPKVGIEVPEEIKELGFKILQSDREDKFNLNFQGQLDPLFLIGQSEVVITSFFNTVFKITKFERALKDINNDSGKISREYEAKNEKLLLTQNELTQVSQEMVEVEREVLKLDILLNDINILSNNIRDIEQSEVKFDVIKSIGEQIGLYGLVVVDMCKYTTYIKRNVDFINKYTLLKDYELKLQQINEDLCNLHNKHDVMNSIFSYIKTYIKCASNLTEADKYISKIKMNHSEFNIIKKKEITIISIISFVEGYLNNITNIGSIKYFCDSLNEIDRVLVGLREKANVMVNLNTSLKHVHNNGIKFKDNIEKLNQIILNLVNNNESINKLTNNYKTITLLFDELEKYKVFLFDTVGKCPTCGKLLGDHKHA